MVNSAGMLMLNKDNQTEEIRMEKNKQKRRAIGPPFLNDFIWVTPPPI
jgi:hypothetical protein